MGGNGSHDAIKNNTLIRDLDGKVAPGAGPPGCGNVGIGGALMPCLTGSDLRLAERAQARLRSNPYLALKNVSCEGGLGGDEAGAVVLSGCLPSYYLKQVAQTVVAQVEGVRRIENRIQVVSP